MRRISAWSVGRSEMSRSNVSSTEIETRFVSSSRSRGSIPSARSRSSGPIVPGSTTRSSASLSAASSPTVFTPAAREPQLGLRADAGQRPHRERRQEARLGPGRHDGDPAGLAPVGGDLADDLRRRDAERARERRRGAHGRLHRLGHRPGAGEGRDDGAEIEVALVDADLLDARHDLADRAPDGLRVLPVERMARAHEDDLGAAAERLGGAHRRPDPEPPGDVVRGRDDAAALRVAADDERPRAQRRVLQLLDGGEERVEVEMREDRHVPNATVPP